MSDGVWRTENAFWRFLIAEICENLFLFRTDDRSMFFGFFLHSGFFLLSISPTLLDGRSTESKRSHNLNKPDQDKWLDDEAFYGNGLTVVNRNMDGFVADRPIPRQTSEYNRCPPVPKTLRHGVCSVPTCRSDRQCREKKNKCCYNGCVYTCMMQIEPPANLDWLKEPRRRLHAGLSWLIEDAVEYEDVETCSVSPVGTDEDPLLCPTGYICYVGVKARKRHGKNAIGKCVKKADVFENEMAEENRRVDTGSLTSKTSCFIDDKLVLNGASITYEGLSCECRRGSLSCEMGS